MSDLVAGQVIAARYRIVRKLGEGDVGATYEAQDAGGQRCLVKVLADKYWGDAEQLRRFEKEAAAAALLKSPYIVEVRDHGCTDEGGPFLVIEPLVGGTLAGVLSQRGAFAEATAVALLSQLCEGLTLAHAAGVVHRDLCPENVFIEVGQGGLRAKLLGFGAARVPEVSGRGMTMAGLAIGTPEYMAPEVGNGQTATMKADLYALGCVAYHMLCGQPPFVSKNVIDLLMAHADKAPTPLRWMRPEISAHVEAAVLQALAKEPAQRPASAADLKAAIEGRDAGAAEAPLIVPVGAALGDDIVEAGFSQAKPPQDYQPPASVKGTMIGGAGGPLPLPPAAPPTPAAVGMRSVAQPGVASVPPQYISPAQAKIQATRPTERVDAMPIRRKGLPIWALVALAVGIGALLGGVGFALLR